VRSKRDFPDGELFNYVEITGSIHVPWAHKPKNVFAAKELGS